MQIIVWNVVTSYMYDCNIWFVMFSPFIDNVCGADLADMQIISKFYQGICFLLCVIDVWSKYASVVALKDRKGVTTGNAFQNMGRKKQWILKQIDEIMAWKNAIEIY